MHTTLLQFDFLLPFKRFSENLTCQRFLLSLDLTTHHQRPQPLVSAIVCWTAINAITLFKLRVMDSLNKPFLDEFGNCSIPSAYLGQRLSTRTAYLVILI